MVSQLDKFIACVNQCVSSKEGPFFIDMLIDVKLIHILNILKTYGFLHYYFISDNSTSASNKHFRIVFELMDNGRPIIRKLARVSKSSRRVYMNFYKLKRFFYKNNNIFYLLLSTSFGLKLLNTVSLQKSFKKFGGEPLLALFI